MPATWAKHLSYPGGGYVNLDEVTRIDLSTINGTDWFFVASGAQLTGTWPSQTAALDALTKILTFEGGVVDPSTI